jgi:hypothetical protein
MRHCNGILNISWFLMCVWWDYWPATDFPNVSALLRSIAVNPILLHSITWPMVHLNSWCNHLLPFLYFGNITLVQFYRLVCFSIYRGRWPWRAVLTRLANQGFSAHQWHQYLSRHKFVVMASVLMKRSCCLVALMVPWFSLMKEEA